ncbi:MAG: hypothetical protein WEE89_09335 [Gemmatimonadota bacterium]
MGPDNLDEHFQAEGEFRFIGLGEHFHDTPPDVPLWQLLLVPENDLKKFARDVAAEPADSVYQSELTRLRNAVAAYTQFQDVMAIAAHPGDPVENRHYCYFQSLVYLRESAVSFLDKNVLAAFTLMRPFLELSVLHLYWFARCELSGYKPFYQWLEIGAGKPPFRNAVEQTLPQLPGSEGVPTDRVARLVETLLHIYKGASAYNHSPGLDESIVTVSRGIERMSRDTFFFYLIWASALVTQITFSYILAYPMILFPVSRVTKFGFGGPIGMFSEHQQFAYIERLLGRESTSRLRESLRNSPHVVALLDQFESWPTLSRSEIEQSWDRESRHRKWREPNHVALDHRLAMKHGSDRSMHLAMNNLYLEPPPGHDIPEEALPELDKLMRDW